MSRRAPVLLCVMVLCSVSQALADNGRLLMRQPAGPWTVSLFVTPETLGTGPADFSTMIEETATGQPVLDAETRLTLTPPEGAPIVIALSHAAAANRLLQAGTVHLSSPGQWHAEVDVREGGRAASAATELTVAPRSARRVLVWALALFPFVVLGLLALAEGAKVRARNHHGRALHG